MQVCNVFVSLNLLSFVFSLFYCCSTCSVVPQRIRPPSRRSGEADTMDSRSARHYITPPWWHPLTKGRRYIEQSFRNALYRSAVGASLNKGEEIHCSVVPQCIRSLRQGGIPQESGEATLDSHSAMDYIAPPWGHPSTKGRSYIG